MDIEAPMAVILEAEPRRALLRCCVRMCVRGVPRRGTGAGLKARVGVCRAGGEGGSSAVRCLSLLGGGLCVRICVGHCAPFSLQESRALFPEEFLSLFCSSP